MTAIVVHCDPSDAESVPTRRMWCVADGRHPEAGIVAGPSADKDHAILCGVMREIPGDAAGRAVFPRAASPTGKRRDRPSPPPSAVFVGTETEARVHEASLREVRR